MDSASDCTLWGCKMDLLRGSPFALLLFLIFLAARSKADIYIFFFSMAALQKQRGGPGRVNSLPSSISHSSDFQSEIPGVSWGQRYRQESLSDMSLLPHWLPQAHWNTSGHLILCPTDRETVLWRNYGPDYVRFSSLPLKLRGKSLILRLVVLYFNKRNPSVFFLHTFFLIFLWGFRGHY